MNLGSLGRGSARAGFGDQGDEINARRRAQAPDLAPLCRYSILNRSRGDVGNTDATGPIKLASGT